MNLILLGQSKSLTTNSRLKKTTTKLSVNWMIITTTGQSLPPFLVPLELLRGGDDEGDGGDDHHGEGEESQELGQLGCPGIFYCAPQHGPPLAPLAGAEVLLLRLLQGSLLGVQVVVLLALTDVQLREILEGAAGLHAADVVESPVLQVSLEHQSTASLCGVQSPSPPSYHHYHHHHHTTILQHACTCSEWNQNYPGFGRKNTPGWFLIWVNVLCYPF